MIASDAIQIVLMDTTAEAAPLFARGTLGFERTVITVFGMCPIATRSLRGMGRKVVEFFSSRTDVDITLGVVLELLRAKERGAVVVVGRGNVGMDVLALDNNQVLFGAVLAVAGGLPGPQFPAEACPEDASRAWACFPRRAFGATNTFRMMRDLPPSTT
jgi:hypothetical protein